MMKIDALELAQALIRCPSVTPEDAGALDVLQNALQGLGFHCTRLPFSQDGEPTVDNLYARLGTGAPFFSFAGHTDVVPPGDAKAWSVPPFSATARDGFLVGRGAEDMKAAIACMVAAAAQVLPVKGSIGFIITGAEEAHATNGTRKIVQWLRERNEIPDACIVGEPTNPEAIGDMIKIGRRGSAYFVLTVHGRQGHVAYPHLADNPVTKLVDILHRLKHHTLDNGTEFFPPSNLEITSVDVGNPADNVIPSTAQAHINLRFNDQHTSASLVQWIKSICDQYTPGGYTLSENITGDPFLTKPGALSSLACAAVKDVTGKTPQLTTTGGTSDARFIKDLCPVVEFGTTNKTAHMVNEKVKLADIDLLTRCYAEMLRRYFSG